MKTLPMRVRTLVPIALLFCMIGETASAELRLPALFGDHMVLQRGQEVTLWGWAAAGETVSLSFADQSATALADPSGTWRVTLSPLSAESAGRDLVVASGGQTVTVHDVVVGDVWHASGQSNMEMRVDAVAARIPEAKEHIAEADLPAIRIRRIGSNGSPTPLADLPEAGAWTVCTPTSAPAFSAVAFYFARALHTNLDVPIGIIDTSRGGTPIEPFIPREAFTGHPTLEREAELGDRNDLEGIWRLPGGVRARDENWLPGRLFNSRLAPLTDFAVRGLIWYQGESNSGAQEDPRDYRHKMTALVRGWRAALNTPELPVYFVQLPGSGAGPGWPYLREEQRLSAAIPNTGMAVTIDLLDEDIHPPNKIDVGDRLARWALAKTYGRDIAYSGPLFERVDVAGKELILHFQHAESGLMLAVKEGLNPPRETPEAHLNHIEVADSNGQWHPAEATIVGQTVMVHSAAVDKPIAARYGYGINPEQCNLYNRNGLPAAPFCTHPELRDYDPGLPSD